MNKITKKMLTAILSVTFSFVALGTVTFAWFTLTNTATVYPIDLEISTNGGIEMAFMPLPNDLSKVKDPAYYGLYSTAAYQNEVNFDMLKDYFEELGYDDDFEGLKNVTSSDGINFKDMNDESVDELTAGGVFKFSVVIRSLVPNQNVYLTPFTSLTSNPIEWKSDANFQNSQGVDLKPGDVVTYYAANAARMSFYSIDFDEEEVDYKFVYELPEGAYGEGFSALYGNKKQGTKAQENGTVSYYNAKHITGRIKPGDVSDVELVETQSSFLYQTPIARIPNDAQDNAGYYYTAVEIRIWLEGWDADNIDAIIQSQIKAQIQFTTEQPTGYVEEVYLENAEGEFELVSSPVEHLAPVGERVSMTSVANIYSENYELVTSKLEGVVDADELLVLSQSFRRKEYEIKFFSVEDNIDVENPDAIRKFKFGTLINLDDLVPAGYRLALYTDESKSVEFPNKLMPTNDLIATLVKKQITVKFESNGGDLVEDKVGPFGKNLELPTNMEKVGHAFAGWFTDKNLITEFNLDTFPTEDLTLYAKWEINQYTISFESDGEVEVDSITQEYGTNVVPPQNPERDGFTFAGWYKELDFINQYIFGTMPAEDITLYARWEINQYTISFKSNGGGEVASITQEYGTDVVQPQNPERVGFIFAGWYTEPEFVNQYIFGTMPAKNITLYARWEINQYTISFESDGEVEVDSITQEYGTNVVPPQNPEKEGHTFAGWYTDDGTFEEEYTFTTMPAEDIELFAKWDVNEYTITFVTNGGGEIEQMFIEYGTELEPLPVPTFEGNNFEGWFTDDELTDSFELPANMPAENITLYAKWSE